MPPKQAPNKKTTDKIKTKIVEDKTFGLKNKKGAKQQKFIQQVQKQADNKVSAIKPRDIPGEDRDKKKEEEKRKKEELAALFKPVLQTVGKGVDPKSVVCVYFKQGLCQKGDKCKFSHDLNVERKSEKRSIYDDTREKADGMENWDEEKLEDVINKKHGEDNKKKNQTSIVCKFFIEAVENKTYGWFWACPNGEACIYKHALPPGFTLKSDARKKEMDGEEVSLEMLIEKERAALGSTVTKITLETFLAWKAKKIREKKDERIKQDEKKRTDFKLGFMNGLTGRDIFTFNPDMITNDDDGGADIDYKQREYDDDEEGNEAEAASHHQVREISADFFASQAREVDNSGTVATDDRFSYIRSQLAQQEADSRLRKAQAEEAAAAAAAESNGGLEQVDEEEDEEEEKKNLKKLLTGTTNGGGAECSSGAANIEIDESLFNADDLDEIRDELEDLDI